MKIALPVIATVAVLTLLQASYPLVREAKAARPILALTNMPKPVLDNTTVQVHVNGNDGTITVNGQEVPAGQTYVQNDATGSIQIAPTVKKTVVGPDGQSTTTMEFKINGSSQVDPSSLSPEQQALIQKAIQGAMKGGQSSSVVAFINGKQVDPQQVKSLLNMSGINLSINTDPSLH